MVYSIEPQPALFSKAEQKFSNTSNVKIINGLSEEQREPRPAILAEVQDIRTEPWGYAAREIIQFLIRMDYRWFAIAVKGALLPISCDQDSYDANLVALPVERTEEFLSLLGQK
jgi:hypothetical protein